MLVLGRRPAEVERGRRFVEAACAGCPEEVVITATLLASELITNALDHGQGEITLMVSRTQHGIRVDVADESPLPPRARRSGPDDERGRGLLIVESLASSWGMETLPQGGGKSVWFVLDAR